MLAIFILSGLCFGQNPQITIPEGTKIRVRLEQDLSSSTAQEGQSVQLSVMDAVMIGNTVAIAQGANVFGTVIVAQEKRRLGRTGKLDFSVDRVFAVDQAGIPLRYTPIRKKGGSKAVSTGIITAGVSVLFFPAAPLVLLRKGKDANIVRGMTFDVFTDQSHDLSTFSDAVNAVAKTAHVNIESIPSGADVEVDGDFVGSTPLSLDIPAGDYEVVVKKKGFIDWSRSLKTAGANINVNAELEQDAQVAQKPAGEEAMRLAMARPEAEDTPEEKIFRTYLRARLDNLDVLGDNEVVSIARGKFKLDEIQALRVFEQEIERINQKIIHNENIKKYTEDFELFIVSTKGVITKSERDTLNAIAESLSLTAEDIKTVESAYTFKDESASGK